MRLKLLSLAFGIVAAVSFEQGTHHATPIERIVMIETKVPTYLPVKNTKYVKKQIDVLAAAIPASALKVSK